MSCENISKAFQGSTCKNAMAGIKNLWIGAFEDTTESIIVDGVVDSVQTGGADVKFWKFTLPIDIGNANENASADPTLGTSFVELEINGTLLGLQKEYSVELTKMMRGKQILVAELYTKDDSGNTVYVLYGPQNGVDMTGGGSRTGDAAASLQGYELTWTGKERDFAPFAENVCVANDPTNGDYLEIKVCP